MPTVAISPEPIPYPIAAPTREPPVQIMVAFNHFVGRAATIAISRMSDGMGKKDASAKEIKNKAIRPCELSAHWIVQS